MSGGPPDPEPGDDPLAAPTPLVLPEVPVPVPVEPVLEKPALAKLPLLEPVLAKLPPLEPVLAKLPLPDLPPVAPEAAPLPALLPSVVPRLIELAGLPFPLQAAASTATIPARTTMSTRNGRFRSII